MMRRALPQFATVLTAFVTLHPTSAAAPTSPERAVVAAPDLAAAPSAVVPRTMTIPAGTVLRLRLENGVGSDISSVEDPVGAQLVNPVTIGGHTVLRAGSSVRGAVTSARRSGKVQGRARLGMRFYSITPAGEGESYRMSTRPWAAVAPATKQKDAATIAIPAAGGAIIGGLAGGKKGAAIGATAGGGAGTAVVLTTRGKEVRLGRGAVIAVRLSAPLTVHAS
jgi:hypothetical protein